jgi:predicted dehydrogenase
MLFKLSKGTIGHAISSGRIPFGRRPIEIHGSTGTLVIDNAFAYLAGDGGDPTLNLELVNANGKSVRRFASTPCFQREVEQFGRAIEGKGAVMTSAEEALAAIRISDAFYETVRTGRVADVSILN